MANACKCSPLSSLVNIHDNGSKHLPRITPKHIWFGKEWRQLFSDSVYTELQELSTSTPTNGTTGRFFTFDWDNRVGIIFYDLRCAFRASHTGEVLDSLTDKAVHFLHEYSSAISLEASRRLLAVGRWYDGRVAPIDLEEIPHVDPDCFDARLVTLYPCGGTSFVVSPWSFFVIRASHFIYFQIGQIMNQVFPSTSAIANGFKKQWGRPVHSDSSGGWSIYLGPTLVPSLFLDLDLRPPACPNVKSDRGSERPTVPDVEAHTFDDSGTDDIGGLSYEDDETESLKKDDDVSEYFTCCNSSVDQDPMANTYDIEYASTCSIHKSPSNDDIFETNFRASIPPLIPGQVEGTDSEHTNSDHPSISCKVQHTVATTYDRFEIEDPNVALLEFGYNLNYRPPVIGTFSSPRYQTSKRRAGSAIATILDSPRSFLSALGKKHDGLLVGVGRVKLNRRKHP